MARSKTRRTSTVTLSTGTPPAASSPPDTPAAGMPAALTQKPTHAPPVYSPEAGKAALEAMAPELAGIAEADTVTLRLDVEAATFAALGVAGFVAAPEVHARFARLPADEFDMRAVDGLAQACFATLYALAEARAAGALETEAKIPPEILAESAEIEARMQALCEYHFPDDPLIRPELDRLRPGAGYRDRVNDLLGYARIYDLRPDVVKSDPKHYRPTDAARARELAGVLIQALAAAMTPRARAAYSAYTRAWTLLHRRYEEVRAAGLWLYRADPARDVRFPSLFAAARPNVGRPKKQAPADSGGAADTPAGPPQDPAADPASPSPG